MHNGAPELAPRRGGRVFVVSRIVRLGDVLPSGEARLDALARYLQDAAADDAADAPGDGDVTWVVRRTAVAVTRRPRLGERLELATWASGAGSRWAERRTTVRLSGSSGGAVLADAVAVWVCLDRATGRPARLTPRFWDTYGEAIDGRSVSSRLTHADPPGEGAGDCRPWPLRVADIDILDHLNNAAAWTAVDDELHRRARGRPVVGAEMEYRGATEADADLHLCSDLRDGEARMWLVAGGAVQVSAVVRLSPGGAVSG